MRMAKSPQEHIDRLRRWLQFNDELCKIDPTSDYDWDRFMEDWGEDERFVPIIKHCTEEGEYYWDYYDTQISHIHMRILMGYEVLVDNVCDTELDYLDFNKELKAMIKRAEENQEHKQDEQQETN
jgi:hypothetical protein